MRWLGFLVVAAVGCSDEAGSSTGVPSGGPEAGGANGSDAGARGGAGASFVAVPVATPPTYTGSVDNGPGCDQPYGTAGFEPDGSGARYPLFLYFVGTRFVATDASARHDSEAPLAVTEAMARRGFVALSVAYDNSVAAWLDPTQENQLRCLFDASHSENLLGAACGLAQVDCDLGIGAWGHSQGAFVAHSAHDYDDRVRAVWTTGYGGKPTATLPSDRLRVVNGEADVPPNNTADGLNVAAGYDAGGCTGGTSECLRPDGSGWILVRAADLADPSGSSADHCWFDRPSCTSADYRLEPNWVDPASDKPFALETNADWVAATVARP